MQRLQQQDVAVAELVSDVAVLESWNRGSGGPDRYLVSPPDLDDRPVADRRALGTTLNHRNDTCLTDERGPV